MTAPSLFENDPSSSAQSVQFVKDLVPGKIRTSREKVIHIAAWFVKDGIHYSVTDLIPTRHGKLQC